MGSYIKAGSAMGNPEVDIKLAFQDNGTKPVFTEWLKHHESKLNALWGDTHIKSVRAKESDFGDPINTGLWPIFKHIKDNQ